MNHPHIVTLYDITSADHSDVIAMEYVEGQSLRAMVSRGPIDLKRAVDIVAQIASALAAAHQAGIIHRDIKPENVVVTGAGHAKVLDFGLAKVVQGKEDVVASSELTTTPPQVASETKSGMMVGTVAYISPEQAEAGQGFRPRK